MKNRWWSLFLMLLAALSLGMVGCSTGDDDDTTGDDDDATGDDDDATGDDDDATGDDDDATGDDDDATGDDDDDDDDIPPVAVDGATSIAIANDQGDVSLIGEAGATEVTVSASFSGGTQDEYERVTIEAELLSSTISVVASVPDDLPDVRVALEVVAPADLDYHVGADLGHVTVDGMSAAEGEVIADDGTVTGTDLVVDALEVICSGGVALELDELETGGALEVTAGSAIGLLIPTDTSASVTAATEDGDVKFVNLSCMGTNAGGVAACVLGSGTGNFQLVTNMGDITLTGY